MRRNEAIRRHRRFLVLYAAFSGVILALLLFVAPRVQQTAEESGIRVNGMTRGVLEFSQAIEAHRTEAILLYLTLIGLAWSTFSLIETRSGPRPSRRP